MRGSCEIAGTIINDFAVVSWSDTGVDEHALQFCYERAIYRGKKSSTIENECYILADWFNWLNSRRKSIETALPSDYHKWGNTGAADREIGAARRFRRKEVIWQFYKHLKSDADMGPKTATIFEMLSEASVAENGVVIWSMKLKSEGGRGSRGPVVPTKDEVVRILEDLGDRPDPFLSERNFLIGHVEARTGLRAIGVESLSIATLDKMLASSGIRAPICSVDNLHSNKIEQVRIRRDLNELADRGRTVVAAEVVEKGGKTREVEVPIDLAIKLLNHVWGRRQALIKHRYGGSKRNGGKVFLSFRNAAPLARGAIKDLVKESFLRENVKGSGHSLRAYYLTTKAIELIKEARIKFGNKYSPEDIFNELARLAGHSHRKTLMFYLDLARLREAAICDLQSHCFEAGC